MRKLRPIILGAGIAAALATGALADNYRASIWQPDQEPNSVATKWFAEELAKATDGKITFEVFTGGVLMPPRSQLQGIGDGVVQMGSHTSGYTPSELPNVNALSGFGFVELDPFTISLAFADWVMTSEIGNEEYGKHNAVALGAFSTPLYPILCSSAEPITTLEQLKGKKIRFGGGQPAKLAQDLGIVPVNVPAPEIYQAMQSGQIDCASILAAWLNIDASLDEVTKSVTLLDWMGSFNSPAQVYNRDFWSSLTAEQRRAIFELAARAQAKVQIMFLENNKLALERAKEKGIAIVKPDESINKAVADWIANGVGDMAGVAKSAYGVEDPEKLFASFRPYIDKWRGVMAGVKDKMNEDEMTEVIIKNLYDQLDPATYRVK